MTQLPHLHYVTHNHYYYTFSSLQQTQILAYFPPLPGVQLKLSLLVLNKWLLEPECHDLFHRSCSQVSCQLFDNNWSQLGTTYEWLSYRSSFWIWKSLCLKDHQPCCEVTKEMRTQKQWNSNTCGKARKRLQENIQGFWCPTEHH